MEVLFRTIHGSRLYGLHHDNSDYDYYTVVSKPEGITKSRYAKHKVSGQDDSLVVDFGTWVELCKSGVPQALEAMFSDLPEVDKIADFRRSFRASPTNLSKYFRTIKSFALASDDGIKHRRHALRLGLNAGSIGKYGRFNPTLSPDDIDYISRMATKSHNDVLGLANCLAW